MASRSLKEQGLAELGSGFSWNSIEPAARAGPTPQITSVVFDETLRDGLQASYVTNPSTDEKLQILDHMMNCGISAADLGFPGSRPAATAECIVLAEHAADGDGSFVPGFAGRTHPSDVSAICDVAQAVGTQVDAYVFTGVSPVRQYVEGWDIGLILERIRASVKQCQRSGVEFVLVLEDTTRCTPEILERIYETAAEIGVRRLTLCDTVGVISPAGTETLINWSAEFFRDAGHKMDLEWHGHNDRGLAVVNALKAAELGCVRVHGAVLGIGERAGNASIDQMLLNGFLNGEKTFDLKALRTYCIYASEVLRVPIPVNYPAVGRDVFKTSAGVHAAAILKAYREGNPELQDSVYSSVPARMLGREQEVQIDASSGASNVEYWMAVNGIDADADVVSEILENAKRRDRPLDDREIWELVKRGSK